jgi:antitoxin FitA
MATIAVNIPDDRMEKLKKLAHDSQITTEELVNNQIESLLSSAEEFDRVAKYVLQKNAELYRRLA